MDKVLNILEVGEAVSGRPRIALTALVVMFMIAREWLEVSPYPKSAVHRC